MMTLACGRGRVLAATGGVGGRVWGEGARDQRGLAGSAWVWGGLLAFFKLGDVEHEAGSRGAVAAGVGLSTMP